MSRVRFLAVLLCCGLAMGFTAASAAAQPSPPSESQAGVSAPETTLPLPALIALQPGELRSLTVGGEVTRIAVGNPDIIDVSVISGSEILLKAKAAGTTNLILWDQAGSHVSQVEVADQAIDQHLTSMLAELNLKGVTTKRENSKLFLIGTVESQDELTRINQLVTAYGGQVTNLVAVLPPPPPPPAPPPPAGKSVALTVQLIEMSRSATDEIGMDWAGSVHNMSVTETPTTASRRAMDGLIDSLSVGTWNRSALIGKLKALVEKGKVRILAEPKLVAGSGKEAKATLGVEVPIVTKTDVSVGVVTQTIEFKNTGVEMSFKPTILPDGRSVQLAVKSKVSSIDTSDFVTTIQGIKVPSFRIRESETEVVTELGQTLMIAGLLQDEERKAMSQVPALGSVPVFGNLFRSTEFVRGTTELVIVISIDLLGDGHEAALDRSFTLEQALAGADLAGAVEDPTLRYVLLVQDRIAKAIRYPAREKDVGVGGEAKLRLHLFRDGTLGQVVISEPSGIGALDAEALKAAETQAPYPPFSSELPQQDLWLEIPVIFRP